MLTGSCSGKTLICIMVSNYSSELSANLHYKSTVRQVVSVFFIIISTIGNSLVLFAIYRFRSLRTISNMIIFNLSITDLLFSLAVVPVMTFAWSKNKSTISSSLCSVIGFEGQLLSLVSIYTLAFVSVERFLATNYPLRHRSIFTRKVVKIGLLFIWIFSTLVCVVSFITERFVYIEKFYHCMLDWENSKEFALVLFGLAYVFPLLSLLCCNVLIIKAVWKSRRFMSAHTSGSSRNGAGFFKGHRTTLLTVAVIVAFILLWTPYFTGGSSLTLKFFSLPKEFMSTAFLLVCANGAFNPLIYGVMNKNLRSAYSKILCKRR